MQEGDLTTYLRENPRMMGVLFTMLLLFTQAGNATAAHALSTHGP